MKRASAADVLAGLYPPSIGEMAVALDQVRIPGPPAEFGLTAAERSDRPPAVRYHRRVIQHLAGDDAGDRLAMIDKASPHAQHDLMLSEISAGEKATPPEVSFATGHLLWRTGLSFVRFLAEPEVREAFALDGAMVHLAMNCDPHTRDRESIQAAKQVHLHLICWSRPELQGLARPGRLARVADSRLLRQILDPLAFLGADLIHDVMASMPAPLAGAAWLRPDRSAVLAGERPFGGVLRLPSWAVLEDPAFARLVEEIHRRLAERAAALLCAFTGCDTAPPPWRRHALLRTHQILANLDGLPLSSASRAGLGLLARQLRDLPAPLAHRLARTGPARRRHCMSLNQPSYALCLQGVSSLKPIEAAVEEGVLMTIQPKLFSGIGGAGLVSLAGVPCVRIARGSGAFTDAQWACRARFQRAFAAYNVARLGNASAAFGPVWAYRGSRHGWVEAPFLGGGWRSIL